jgi:hypothetical protein
MMFRKMSALLSVILFAGAAFAGPGSHASGGDVRSRRAESGGGGDPLAAQAFASTYEGISYLLRLPNPPKEILKRLDSTLRKTRIQVLDPVPTLIQDRIPSLNPDKCFEDAILSTSPALYRNFSDILGDIVVMNRAGSDVHLYLNSKYAERLPEWLADLGNFKSCANAVHIDPNNLKNETVLGAIVIEQLLTYMGVDRQTTAELFILLLKR